MHELMNEPKVVFESVRTKARTNDDEVNDVR